jgi:hypothetical protein
VKRVAVVVFLSGWVAFLTVGLSGCGGSSSAPPIGVSLASSVAGNAIDQAQTVSITASVTNDSKNAGVTWSVSGGGTLSNQTTTAATYNAPPSVTSAFTAIVTATSITNAAESASVQIKVNPLPAIAPAALPAANAGTPYSATPSESGGTSPLTWSVTPTLPAGLSLNSSTGLISGTPTGGGSGSFTFKVLDAAGNSASQALTVTVNPPLVALTVTTGSLPGAALAVAYNQTLQATGGVPSYKWSLTAGSLPAGLSLSSAGVISGTPSGTVGTSNFSVTVTDSQTPTPATSTANLSITVSLAPLTITTTALLDGSVGNAYSQTLQAIGGTPPYSWSILLGALPVGFTLNGATGAITGTPSATGTSNFTIKVTDSATGAATANLSITINPALAITTTSLPGGSVGTAYSSTVQASGGLQPYAWKITSGSLPAGLSINSGSGNISGTPSTTGVSTFTVTVTDSESLQATASSSLSISIATKNCTNDASLQGNYALVSSGWSSLTTAASAAGSFAADGNGNITGGLLDLANQDSSSKPQSGTFTGTYCVASNNLATISLTYGGGLRGTNTFGAALDSSDGNGHIMSYDNSDLKVSGLLRKQNTSVFSTGMIDGNYAFGLVGADPLANRFAMAGEFNSNGSGTLSGENDSDDGGLVHAAQTLSASDFIVASTGRGTATITFSTGNTNFVFYVVSSSEMLMMAFDTTETPPIILAGQVLQQSGSFTDASVDGVSVLELQSLGNSGSEPTVTAGLITTTGNSATYTVSADQNQGGTMSTQSDSGTFSVSSSVNGRVKLTPSGGGSETVLYLVEKNQAFVIGTDDGVSYGTMEPQTGSDFNDASLSGNYLGGSQPAENANVSEEADYLNSNGSGTLSGTSDTNGSGGPVSAVISATYQVSSSGRVIVSQSGTPVVYMYMISPSQAVALPVSSSQNQDTYPKLVDFHQ